MTIAEVMRQSGLDLREAELLMAFAAGQSRTWVFAHTNDPLDEVRLRDFRKLAQRRIDGEPVAYLLGKRAFWTVELGVAPGVLIPRGETEVLVEAALASMRSLSAPRVLDMGTGSGAIALALASERPDAEVLATDLDTTALEIARANAQRLELGNVEFRQSAWFDALAGDCFDIIVSNPPYIAEADRHLEQGDLRFEPRHALASGEDGLDALREIIAGAPQFLPDSGWLAVEHGFDQAESVQALFHQADFGDVRTHADLQRHPRVTEGRAAKW